MTRIKDCEKPLYFYSLFKDYKQDSEYLKYLSTKSLCLPLKNNDGEVRGFIPYDLYDGFIRDSLKKDYINDKEYKKLYKECMVEKGEDKLLYFDANKCANKLYEMNKNPSIKTLDEFVEETKEETEEDTISILNNIFGE